MSDDDDLADPTADPDYAAAAELWNGMTLEQKSRLLKLVIELHDMIAGDE